MSDDTRRHAANAQQQQPKPAAAATMTEPAAEKASAELTEEQLGGVAGGEKTKEKYLHYTMDQVYISSI
jgi:hypothetical protein